MGANGMKNELNPTQRIKRKMARQWLMGFQNLTMQKRRRVLSFVLFKYHFKLCVSTRHTFSHSVVIRCLFSAHRLVSIKEEWEQVGIQADRNSSTGNIAGRTGRRTQPNTAMTVS